MKSPEVLLSISDLTTVFHKDEGVLNAVDGIDLTIQKGQIFGLVGESGSGKTVTALSIMNLIEEPGEIVSGSIIFRGISLLKLAEDRMAELRGDQISMVFQDPQIRLNPVFPVGDQIAEIFTLHQGLDRKEAKKQAVHKMEQVGIPDPEWMMGAYAHQLSGGQAQRVMIAMAIALKPELIIADEPTSALDVTIQAQILELFDELNANDATSILLISHDLGVIAELADRVAVMYAGVIVEEASVESLFDHRLHPYTGGLIASLPNSEEEAERLQTIPGALLDRADLPPGCRFSPRCSARVDFGLMICESHEPDIIERSPGHFVRCWLYQDGEGHRAPLRSGLGLRLWF